MLFGGHIYHPKIWQKRCLPWSSDFRKHQISRYCRILLVLVVICGFTSTPTIRNSRENASESFALSVAIDFSALNGHSGSLETLLFARNVANSLTFRPDIIFVHILREESLLSLPATSIDLFLVSRCDNTFRTVYKTLGRKYRKILLVLLIEENYRSTCLTMPVFEVGLVVSRGFSNNVLGHFGNFYFPSGRAIPAFKLSLGVESPDIPCLKPRWPSIKFILIQDNFHNISENFSIILDEAAKNGLQIYGRGWDKTRWRANWRGSISDSEKNRLYCAARSVLIELHGRNASIYSDTLKVFEAISFGGPAVISNQNGPFDTDVSSLVFVPQTGTDISRFFKFMDGHEQLIERKMDSARLKLLSIYSWSRRAESVLGIYYTRRNAARTVKANKPPLYVLSDNRISLYPASKYKAITNPSVLLLGQEVMIAGRELSVHTDGKIGCPEWTSAIVIGVMKTNDFISSISSTERFVLVSASAILRKPSRTLHECIPPPGTDFARGPEDPRLFVYDMRVFVLFSSRALREERGEFCTDEFYTRQNLASLKLKHAGNSEKIIHIGMTYAMDAENMTKHEKNWVPITHLKELHFLSSINPHSVLRLKHFAVNQTRLFLERFTLVQSALSSQFRGAIGGGSPLIPVRLMRKPSASKRESFVGTFHMQVSFRNYENYFYVCETNFPFRVVAISSPMPILKLRRGFKRVKNSAVALSIGLVIVNEKIFVSYGSGDVEARIACFSIVQLTNSLHWIT